MTTARALAVLLLLAPAAAQAAPIPTSGPEPSTPKFIGAPATPKPFPGVRPAWTNPFMAPNPLNGVHNDAWQTDSYTQYGGPLGITPETLSTDIGRVCITITFDSKGRIEATCTNLSGPVLYLLDPVTLDTLASTPLPYVPAVGNPATNTTGGAYFYL